MRFAIARCIGYEWLNGVLVDRWEPLRGRRYATRERAEEVFAALETRHDAACGPGGTKHASWIGRFRENHKIVELVDGHYPSGARFEPKGNARDEKTP